MWRGKWLARRLSRWGNGGRRREEAVAGGVAPWDVHFADLAEAVARGDAVDWVSERARATGDIDRGLLDELQQLERAGLGPGHERPEPPSTWGDFELRERIGAGSVGSVYRAWDPNLRHDVALKLLGPGLADRDTLLIEARSLAQVRPHPHVVMVYGAAVVDGTAGFWMELIVGQTLADMLGSQGAFSAVEASAVGIAVTLALSAIHARGLVHQDVKAQNVMRETGGRIVLMDLGASRPADATVAPRWGTPLYMAPELFERAPASAQTDIYSLGVLLFHLATGAFPSNGTSLGDLRPDLPEPFVSAVEQAMSPDPATRFLTAGDMRRSLRRVSS